MFEINVWLERSKKIWLGVIMGERFVWKWRTRMAYHMKTGEKSMKVWYKSKLIIYKKIGECFTHLFSVIKLSEMVNLNKISNVAVIEFSTFSSICFNFQTFLFHWKHTYPSGDRDIYSYYILFDMKLEIR